jgi:asparagine synthase (glutamine-hydrolysing)
MGFGALLDHWFRGDLSEYLHDTLLSCRARGRGFFKARAVVRLIDAHVGGLSNHQNQLWTFLMFELWHWVFLDPGVNCETQSTSVPVVA